MYRSKSIVYLEPKYIHHKLFPLCGIFFLFNSYETSLFLSITNFVFCLLTITREPDIESKTDLVKDRIVIFVLSLVNFIIPIFIPLCLQKISKFPPEDWSDEYSQTNKNFLFKHARLSFNILYHACLFSVFPTIVTQSVILALISNEYIVPASKKLAIGNWYTWVKNERLGYLHIWARKHGWANFISESLSIKITRLLNKLSPYLNSGCLFVELTGTLSCVTLLTRSIWVYLTFMFHLTVFFTAGILFWQNMIILPSSLMLQQYSFFLVLFFSYLLVDTTKTRPLGWITANLCEKVELIGVMQNGEEKVLSNDLFGARERTIGILVGRTAIVLNNQFWHLGETSLDIAQKTENFLDYRYSYNISHKWLTYFKKFIQYSHNPKKWIWGKIIPEGQIFYTQPDKYRFEQPLKSIKFVLKVWHLDENYHLHTIKNTTLKILNSEYS